MSQENVEIARLAYEAFNRGDIAGVLDLGAPDVEWQDLAVIDTRVATGKAPVGAFFETVMEPFEDVRREPEEIIDLGGNRVLVLFHTTGRGKGSGGLTAHPVMRGLPVCVLPSAPCSGAPDASCVAGRPAGAPAVVSCRD